MMREEYVTVAYPSEYETDVKGSRFIAHIERCGSEEDLDNSIDRIKERYPGATHYCYAALYGDNERFSDNGEPSGTAGRPILQVLRGSGLSDVAVIVIRYFGGTLLGTGGLVQAYSGTSAGAVDRAERSKVVLCDMIRFDIPYSLYDKVSECDMIVGTPEVLFTDKVELTVCVRIARKDEFITFIMDMTKGKAYLTHLGERFVYNR